MKNWILTVIALTSLGILAISNKTLLNEFAPSYAHAQSKEAQQTNRMDSGGLINAIRIDLVIYDEECRSTKGTRLTFDDICDIAGFFEWVFNDDSDDKVREYVFGNDCSVLNGNSNDTLITKIGTMIDGPTGDDDELAILKILNCLPCDRVSEIVGTIGRRNLKDEFHGREFDLLMVRLQQCGLAKFSQWDDDATRIFIKNSDCATLTSLTNAEINQLLKNLFEGATLDADEKRIIKLMRCLPCSRRKEIMQMKGSRYRRFDNNVHGSEWDTLKPLLKC